VVVVVTDGGRASGGDVSSDVLSVRREEMGALVMVWWSEELVAMSPLLSYVRVYVWRGGGASVVLCARAWGWGGARWFWKGVRHWCNSNILHVCRTYEPTCSITPQAFLQQPSPPPPRAHASTDKHRFIALADAIEEAYPNVVVEGNPTGPGRPGSFEVTLPDGAVLFSKLNSGGWPQAETVVESIGASAACGLPQQ
jgi:selT/selW/selH-like putative selenoprotein